MEEKKEEIKKELNIEDLKKPAPEGRGSLNEIERQLEECQKLKDEYLAGWQRERADFLNYKRDEWKRLEGILKFAGEGLILKILPILDNFEIAEREVQGMKYEETKCKEAINGILQIKNQILDFLKGQGVEEIKSMEERFNPNFHEVVEEVEVKDKQHEIIVEEIQKGYKINGRLLRPAKVRVAK